MTKKNRKKKNIQSAEPTIDGMSEIPVGADQATPQADTAVDEVSASPIEADQVPAKNEPIDVDPGIQSIVGENPIIDDVQAEVQEVIASDSSDDSLMDDLLADVRSSLIEEEDAGKTEKKSKWWNRLVGGASAQETPDVSAAEEEIADLSIPAAPVTVPSDKNGTGELEQIDELIKLLETDSDEDEDEEADLTAQVASVPLPVAPPPEQEVKIDVDELKKQAFAPRTDDEKPDELGDVRNVALGGEEDVFVEVESKAQDPWEERIKSVENALRPYRTYIYYGLAFIGVIMAIMASVLIYTTYKQSLPVTEPTAAVSLPYPTTVKLPGGITFSLAKGALKDGVWNPRGPEWLEGTEICRWVAIPWSRPLEAAVRTMNRDDVLELTMSNNDNFSYNVESIQELTFAEMQEMDSSSPCLALILAEQDSEKRWVVIARP